MAEIGKILVKLGVDPKGLEKGLKQAEARLKGFGDSARKIGGSFTKFVTLPITAGAALSVRAFAIQEDAVNDLRAALSNTGEASAETMKDFQRFAAQIQKTTKFGDEAILGQIAFAKNLGVQTKDLKKATVAAIGMSAALGIDLRTAFNLIGRASKGQTSLLTRYGIVVDQTKTKQEQFADILSFGASKFSIAQARAKTTSGALEQMKNAVGDLLEVIGKQLAPLVINIANKIKGLAEILQRMNPVLLKNVLIFGGLAAAIGPIILGIGAVASGFGVMLPFMIKGFGIFVKFLPVLKGIAVGFGLVVLKVLAVIAVFAAAVASTRFVIDNFSAMGNFLKSIFAGLKSFIFTIIAKIVRKLEDIPLIGDVISRKMSQTFEKDAAKSLNKFIDLADKAKETSVSFGDSMKGLGSDLKTIFAGIKLPSIFSGSADPAAAVPGAAPASPLGSFSQGIDNLKQKMASDLPAMVQQLETFSQGVMSTMSTTAQSMVQAWATGSGDLMSIFQNLFSSLLSMAVDMAVKNLKILQLISSGFSALFSNPLTATLVIGGLIAGVAAFSKLKPMAKGGIVTGPTPILAGEAGPEAVIPLGGSRASGFLGGGEQKIIVMLDGRILTETVVKRMPGVIRANAGVRL